MLKRSVLRRAIRTLYRSDNGQTETLGSFETPTTQHDGSHEIEKTSVRVAVQVFRPRGNVWEWQPLADYTDGIKIGDTIRHTFTITGVTYAIDVQIPK